MKRREFIAVLPGLALGATGVITPNTSHAIVPFLLRLMLGGVIRGSVSRTVATTVTRHVITTASLGLRASGILAVSTGVALAYEKYGASEIWVAGSAEQGLTVSTEEGAADKREQVYLGYRVVDIETGAVDKVGLKNVSIEPDKKISLSHLVKDLPKTGAKYVEGVAAFDSKGASSNHRFQFTDRKIVIVADPAEVEPS
jgi:hypothetical protein